MEYGDLLDLVQKRRSIRSFEATQLPEGTVEKIVEAARWAPSGYNSQPWEFVAVTEQGLRGRIAEIAVEEMRSVFSGPQPSAPGAANASPSIPPEPGWAKAPVLILIYGDTRVRQYCPIPLVRDDESVWKSTFRSALAIAFQHMALAAAAMNLASQWVSLTNMPAIAARVRKLLGVPDYMEAYDGMAVGYPAQKATEKNMRSLKEMLHYNACGENDFRSDEQVRAYFQKNLPGRH